MLRSPGEGRQGARERRGAGRWARSGGGPSAAVGARDRASLGLSGSSLGGLTKKVFSGVWSWDVMAAWVCGVEDAGRDIWVRWRAVGERLKSCSKSSRQLQARAQVQLQGRRWIRSALQGTASGQRAKRRDGVGLSISQRPEQRESGKERHGGETGMKPALAVMTLLFGLEP